MDTSAAWRNRFSSAGGYEDTQVSIQFFQANPAPHPNTEPDDSASQHPVLKPKAIKAYFDTTTYERGRSYAEEGAVKSLRWIGATLEARVQGSDVKPYVVRVEFEDGDIEETQCSCPMEEDCKHVVAALLALADNPKKAENAPELSAILEPLERDQLEDILIALSEQDDDVYDRIVKLAAMSKLKRTTSGGITPDGESFRAAARAAFSPSPNYDNGYWDDYGPYDGYDVEQELEPVIVPIREMIAEGRAAEALTALDVVTDEYVRAWDGWRDVDFGPEDVLGNATDVLASLWTSVALDMPLSAEERKHWAGALSGWHKKLDDEAFEDSRNAMAHGWDHPTIVKLLAGKDPGNAADTLESEALYEKRARFLLEQKRWEEALHFASQIGQDVSACKALIGLKRYGKAADHAIANVTTAGSMLTICKALQESGERDEALRVGEHGLNLHEAEQEYGYSRPRVELAKWVRDAARKAGRDDLTREAAEIVFEREATLADYKLIRDLSGKAWPTTKEKLLKVLTGKWSHASEETISILLMEEEWDRALDSINGTYDTGLAWRVLKETAAKRPDRVIAIGKRQAESIMDEGRAKHYDEAAEWLKHVRAAYKASDRLPEWKTYLQHILFVHGRKYKLVPMLNALT